MSKKFLVIGGGPAGIEAAKTAASKGNAVRLVTDSAIGGRAGWHSLLPSKVWLAAANTLDTIEEAATLGISVDQHSLDLGLLMDRLVDVKNAWAEKQAADLEQLGVEIVHGTASFNSPNTVEVKDNENITSGSYQADIFIIATGSVPKFPPGLKPDGQRIIAPRFLSHLKNVPRSMIVIGGGPTGCESAYLFNRLGSEVTWVVDQYGILPSYSLEAGEALGNILASQGIKIVSGQMAEKIVSNDQGVTVHMVDGFSHSSEMAFVAVGRSPDRNRLQLVAAGIDVSGVGQIDVDQFGCTTNPGIYVVGDADGGWMIANKAMSQARIAVRHALGEWVKPFHPEMIVQVTFTNPEVAQIGNVDKSSAVSSVHFSLLNGLKPVIAADGHGYIELFFEIADGRIRGAVAVGDHAADLLTPVAVAIHQDMTVDELGEIYGGHPTFGELSFAAARLSQVNQ